MKTRKDLHPKILAFFIVSFLASQYSFALPEAYQNRNISDETAPVALPAIIPQDSWSLPDAAANNEDILKEQALPDIQGNIPENLPILKTEKNVSRRNSQDNPPTQTAAQKTPIAEGAQASSPRRSLKKLSKKTVASLSKFSNSLKESNALGALSHFIDGAKGYPVADIGEGERFAREIEEAPKEINKKGVAASITVFGSARLMPQQKAQADHKKALALARLNPNDKNVQEALKLARQNLQMSKYYEEAYRFGQIVAHESGGKIAVATGGGPGIMEAANRGAFEAGGASIGHTIRLPHEESSNPYITKGLNFLYDNFAPRKINLRRGAVALAFFPGGFGTMDELFETLTLIQTGKIPRVPIVLVGKKYWKQILNFQSFSKMGVISSKDLSLFKIVDTAQEAWAALTAEEKAAQ